MTSQLHYISVLAHRLFQTNSESEEKYLDLIFNIIFKSIYLL